MGNHEKDKAVMPPDIESDLIWFLGRGQSAFERSTCGLMLESLERDSCVSKTCAKCKGQGVIGGDDYTLPDYGAWCEKCKGTGSLPVVLRRSKGALTAKPKTKSTHGTGKTPDDKTLTRYAACSRLINKLQQVYPESVQVLAAYYGNAGTRWAQTEGYSRIFPVIALTRAGETLIKKAHAKELLQDSEQDTGVPRDAHEQIGQLHLVNKIQPDGSRTKLFTEGFAAAERLMDTAIRHWLEVAKR